MITKNLEDIYKCKESDIAVYLCSGSSINNITKYQWKKISKIDTWTVNNWVYHPFIPKFYHPEAKSIDQNILKNRLTLKKDEYRNTNFIVDKSKSINLDVVNKQNNIYLYKLHIESEADKSKYNPKIHLKYKYNEDDPNTLIAYNLSSSATLILDLLWRFKYKKIIIFGMDMYNSKYFWTNESKYGVTHCKFNHDKIKSKTEDDPHKTYRIKDYIIWFCEEWMSKIDCEVFVGHTDTALYPDLKYFEIGDI